MVNYMNFKEEIKIRTENVEHILDKYLPQEVGYQSLVIEAMNYSVNAGGKRLRPILMDETYKLFGGEDKDRGAIEAFMAAIEMIHTYSLVHDDLPAMDNDEYRRGKKTTHAVYGEGMGVLAGDGLLNYAFETALKAFETREDATNIARALQILARKAGIYGMIGGQCADIEAEDAGASVTLEQLLFIHEHKTAALIQAAMMVGAILAGATATQVDTIEKIGYDIGVAFQIQDDILDVIGDTQTLGKQVGSDEKNNKTTYVTIKGLEESQKEQKAMSAHAIELLESFERDGYSNEFLKELIKSLTTRNK